MWILLACTSPPPAAEVFRARAEAHLEELRKNEAYFIGYQGETPHWNSNRTFFYIETETEIRVFNRQGEHFPPQRYVKGTQVQWADTTSLYVDTAALPPFAIDNKSYVHPVRSIQWWPLNQHVETHPAEAICQGQRFWSPSLQMYLTPTYKGESKAIASAWILCSAEGKQLSYYNLPSETKIMATTAPQWNPDGSQILFGVGDTPDSTRPNYNWTLWAPANSLVASLGEALTARWSQDGHSILRLGYSSCDLYKADGSHLKTLAMGKPSQGVYEGCVQGTTGIFSQSDAGEPLQHWSNTGQLLQSFPSIFGRTKYRGFLLMHPSAQWGLDPRYGGLYNQQGALLKRLTPDNLNADSAIWSPDYMQMLSTLENNAWIWSQEGQLLSALPSSLYDPNKGWSNIRFLEGHQLIISEGEGPQRHWWFWEST